MPTIPMPPLTPSAPVADTARPARSVAAPSHDATEPTQDSGARQLPPGRGGVGAILRHAREARGLTVEQVAIAIGAHETPPTDVAKSPCISTVLCRALRRIERGDSTVSREDLATLVLGYEPTSQESDRWYCAAGIVPPDLAELILAAPERLDAVRMLLLGTLGPADVFKPESR